MKRSRMAMALAVCLIGAAELARPSTVVAQGGALDSCIICYPAVNCSSLPHPGVVGACLQACGQKGWTCRGPGGACTGIPNTVEVLCGYT